MMTFRDFYIARYGQWTPYPGQTIQETMSCVMEASADYQDYVAEEALKQKEKAS